MKKNKIMRAALLMLALTLITSSFVGGTLAKYVTSGEGKDTARVAKFGVTVSKDLSLFNTKYVKHDTKATGIGENTVVSGVDVVAPGTSGELAKVELTGTPEVAVRISSEGTLNLKDENGNCNWMVDTNGDGKADKFYCPIVIEMKAYMTATNSTKVNGLDYADADAFADAVKRAITGFTADLDAGKDLSGLADTGIYISWSWLFEGDGSGNVIKQTDAYDTQLGDAAVADKGGTIEFTLTTKVTQID